MNGQSDNRYNKRRVRPEAVSGTAGANIYANRQSHTGASMNISVRGTPSTTGRNRASSQNGRTSSNRGKKSGGNGPFYLILAAVGIAVIAISTVAGGLVASRNSEKTPEKTADTTDTPAAVTDTQTSSETEETTSAPETEKPYTVPEVSFKSDLDEYEKYMNPTGSERDDYLLLVNASHTLDKDYIPEDLTNISNTRGDRKAQQLRLYAAKALDALYIELKAEGYTDVSVTSGYRSYAYQQTLFSDYTSKEMASNPSLSKTQAENIVVTYSSRPGTSEHQSGLCVDMHNLSSADVAFSNTKAYRWLAENSWKFGFILRYPEDKTDVTKISFEPWHYRYVGRYHAARMHELGLCLEEYTELLAKQ